MSLCPEFEQRAAMTDEEFWAHVFPQPPEPGPDDVPFDDDPPDIVFPASCPTCGETGPCSYDAEGRPLIHTYTEPEEE